MKVNPRKLSGPWAHGVVLDKHTLSSTYLGDNEYGHPTFDTQRSETGDCLFRLKYRNDWSQVNPLALALATYALPVLPRVHAIIPMPASKIRARQPVSEISAVLGRLTGIPVVPNLLNKDPGHQQLKDLSTREEKLAALAGHFTVSDVLNPGKWDVLLVDDLFDTGASMEAAVHALNAYSKINSVSVAALTWK